MLKFFLASSLTSFFFTPKLLLFFIIDLGCVFNCLVFKDQVRCFAISVATLDILAQTFNFVNIFFNFFKKFFKACLLSFLSNEPCFFIILIILILSTQFSKKNWPSPKFPKRSIFNQYLLNYLQLLLLLLLDCLLVFLFVLSVSMPYSWANSVLLAFLSALLDCLLVLLSVFLFIYIASVFICGQATYLLLYKANDFIHLFICKQEQESYLLT